MSEVYNKISKILGPSPFSQSSQHVMGPLGLLSPYPGVSYLFAGDAGGVNSNFLNNDPYSENYTEGMSNSLWNIANLGGGLGIGGPLGGSNNSWSASLGEMVLKIDGKMKVSIFFFNNGVL